jgi:quercetin 2,3-dioxygenase
MKFLLRKGIDRLHKKDAWKTSAYAFVPYQTHFGELCGFADDIIEAGQGFGLHPHQNMEISTIVVRGAQAHKDNTGSEGIVNENCVQTMSAGTGIRHSEFNASKTEPVHSYQIWVYPKQLDVEPRHEQFIYNPSEKLNKILLAISPDKRQNSAAINQDAFFSLLELEKDNSISYKMNIAGNGVYIHNVEGKAMIENYAINTGDAIGIYETTELKINAEENTHLIFVEVPMARGIEI